MEEDDSSGTLNQVLLYGPDFWPNPYEQWETSFEMRSGHQYAFTLEDTYGDGFQGSFDVYMMGKNGEETLLTSGPKKDFEFSHTVEFAATAESL